MNLVNLALITEGITDQAVLENILHGMNKFRAGELEIEINPLQPPRDATDEARSGGFGGWEKVIEHCTTERNIEIALAVNDFM